MSAERGHHLILTKSTDWHADEPYFDHQIKCLSPARCNGWQECLEPHQVGDKDARSGPYDCADDDPWCDQDVFEFHGVEHEWRYGYGWTVPFPGCVVAAQDGIVDDVHDIGVEHGEGTYVIDDEWGDPGECYLIFVRRVGDPA